jgi:hypothetical protein
MLTWKFLAPVMAALIGTGITATATTLVEKAGFSCTVPWYTDTTCGLSKLSIPPDGQLWILVHAVTRKGEKWKFPCPVFTIYDATNNKQQDEPYDFMCDQGLARYQNPSREKEQIVYVRVNVKEQKDIDIRGSYEIYKIK